MYKHLAIPILAAAFAACPLMPIVFGQTPAAQPAQPGRAMAGRVRR